MGERTLESRLKELSVTEDKDAADGPKLYSKSRVRMHIIIPQKISDRRLDNDYHSHLDNGP